MSRLFDARVAENVRVNNFFRIISLNPLSRMLSPKPGQFFMLQAGKTNDPLLKRPLSLFRYRDGMLQFLYRIRGKGTVCLSEMKGGDVLQLLGPLGNSYPAPENDFIAVTGGIGIASLFPLLEKHPGKAYLFCGARNCDELLMLDEAKYFAKDVCATTDDGTICRKGLITEPFMEFIDSDTFTGKPMPVYACGPVPMMREMAKIVEGRAMTCHVSLEEVMACGLGACLGCVALTSSGYKRVCKEGPVFRIEDIIWK